MIYLKTLLRKLSNGVFAGVALCLALSMGACVVSRTLPDGTVEVQEPDYESLKLMATASVAAWAAAQKDGIKKQDAETLLAIINVIESYHADGSPLIPASWAPAISKEVPKRYQALAMVLVTLMAHELDKYGVADKVPVAGSVPDKILKSIIEGAKMGLAPYLLSYEKDKFLYGILPAGYTAI